MDNADIRQFLIMTDPVNLAYIERQNQKERAEIDMARELGEFYNSRMTKTEYLLSRPWFWLLSFTGFCFLIFVLGQVFS